MTVKVPMPIPQAEYRSFQLERPVPKRTKHNKLYKTIRRFVAVLGPGRSPVPRMTILPASPPIPLQVQRTATQRFGSLSLRFPSWCPCS